MKLQSGESVVADEAYLRESILTPAAKITAGYQPIMPTFQGLVSEEELLELVEYIKSLQPAPTGSDRDDAGARRASGSVEAVVGPVAPAPAPAAQR